MESHFGEEINEVVKESINDPVSYLRIKVLLI